jgi:integrase
LKEHTKDLTANSYIVGKKLVKYQAKSMHKKMKPIFDSLFNEGLDEKDSKNRVVIHTLRHTFASHLAINGTPIFTIQKLMNHKDIAMTMRYAKLAPDSGKEFVNGLYR